MLRVLENLYAQTVRTNFSMETWEQPHRPCLRGKINLHFYCGANPHRPHVIDAYCSYYILFDVFKVINDYESVQCNYTVSKNVPPLTCYNLYIHGSIATIFSTNVAEEVGNQNILYFATSPN